MTYPGRVTTKELAEWESDYRFALNTLPELDRYGDYDDSGESTYVIAKLLAEVLVQRAANAVLERRASLPPEEPEAEAVHEWFELSYAEYLTIPRSVLQSMPSQWQRRFAGCLRELDATIDWRPKSGQYWVKLRDDSGMEVLDDFSDYERGRRKVAHRPAPNLP